MALRVVSDRDVELEAMAPEERMYELSVVDSFNQVATYLETGEGCAGVVQLVASEADGFDVEKFRRLLVDKAVRVSDSLKFRGSKKFADELLCLRLARLSGCVYILVAPLGEFAIDENENTYHYKFEGPYYIFKAEDFVSADQYRGKRHPDIVKMIGKEFGEGSEQLRDVNRVVDLVRSWLYGKETGWHREAIAEELVELRMKIGAAAIAVIADFLRNYEDDAGSSDDPNDAVLAGFEAYDRLRIGRVSLDELA